MLRPVKQFGRADPLISLLDGSEAATHLTGGSCQQSGIALQQTPKMLN